MLHIISCDCTFAVFYDLADMFAFVALAVAGAVIVATSICGDSRVFLL
jgi:hypothetical protein